MTKEEMSELKRKNMQQIAQGYQKAWEEGTLKQMVDGEWVSVAKQHSGCVCDCEKNYGKGCLNPEKYLSGGCK